MSGAEIRSDESREAPFLLENAIEQTVVFTHIRAVDLVVRAHDRANARFHGGLESREIDFPQSALINNFVDGHAVGLLIIGGEMFGFGDDSLRLRAC